MATVVAGLSLACREAPEAGEPGTGVAPPSVTTLVRSDVPPRPAGEGGGAGIATPFPGAPPELLAEPRGVAVDEHGNIYVADFALRVIKRIDPNGRMTVFAGNGEDAYVDGPAHKASFMGPWGLAFGPDGRLYVTDTLAQRVRVVDRDGTVSTVAGSGPTGFLHGGFADGPADRARFDGPAGIAVAADGTLYLADNNNHRIRRISPAGDVTTFAGSDLATPADGPPGTGSLWAPVGVALAPDGALYVTELAFSALRKVSPKGVITTIVPGAIPGKGLLTNPAGIAVDADGLLWVADSGNHRIVQLTPNGDLIAAFGSGAPGLTDGPAGTASFARPLTIAFAPDGSLIVVDDDHQTVRAIRQLRLR